MLCLSSFSNDNLVPISMVVSSTKVKVSVLHPVQQPGSYWDRFSSLSVVGVGPTHTGDSL